MSRNSTNAMKGNIFNIAMALFETRTNWILAIFGRIFLCEHSLKVLFACNKLLKPISNNNQMEILPQAFSGSFCLTPKWRIERLTIIFFHQNDDLRRAKVSRVSENKSSKFENISLLHDIFLVQFFLDSTHFILKVHKLSYFTGLLTFHFSAHFVIEKCRKYQVFIGWRCPECVKEFKVWRKKWVIRHLCRLKVRAIFQFQDRRNYRNRSDSNMRFEISLNTECVGVPSHVRDIESCGDSENFHLIF